MKQFGGIPAPRPQAPRVGVVPRANPGGHWCCYDYQEDLLKRDKLNLDLFWLQDDSLEDADNLPDIIAAKIAADLLAAYEQFAAITADLKV